MGIQKETYVIDLPFTLGREGKVSVIRDTDPKVWKNKVFTLLSTGILERIWYYNYGINLDRLLFETSTAAIEDARVAITEIFATKLPELALVDLNVEYSSVDSAVILSIIYRLPSGDTDSVKMVTASLTAAGETIEVM